MQHLQKNWLNSRFFDRYSLHYGTREQVVDPATREWIVRGLARAMPTLKIEEYFQAKPNWFSECEYLIVAVDAASNALIGFLASGWVETESITFLHIKIQMIAELYQRTYLLKHMWGFHLHQVCRDRLEFPSIIALKTCHPAVFSAIRIFSCIDGVQMYPRITGEPQEPEMSQIARMIALSISPGLHFCQETGAIENASVPRDFYPSLPTTKKADVLQYFQNNLTLADRILCIVRISTDSAKHRILQVLGEEP